LLSRIQIQSLNFQFSPNYGHNKLPKQQQRQQQQQHSKEAAGRMAGEPARIPGFSFPRENPLPGHNNKAKKKEIRYSYSLYEVVEQITKRVATC
jgi:hypothetical protein